LIKLQILSSFDLIVSRGFTLMQETLGGNDASCQNRG
jgi:hypothetical protein